MGVSSTRHERQGSDAIAHVITDLEIGGAELMLARLLEQPAEGEAARAIVISLSTIGPIGRRLQEQGVPVFALGLQGAASFPRGLAALVSRLRRERPAIVQTWLYHADLLGGLAARICGIPVVWGIRCTAIPQAWWSGTAWLVRLCAMLSRFVPARIVCCAQAARRAHEEMGYAPRKLVVIPNGYRFDELQVPADEAGRARAEFGFARDDVVIVTVGRFDPLKDYATFVRAAGLVCRQAPEVRVLMLGRGIDRSNRQLATWIEETGWASRFLLLGERPDVPRCLAAADVFCLSSTHEGFPNVVVEAMAAAKPCVVTRAGDAALILGDAGEAVPAGAADELAAALLAMAHRSPLEREAIGRRGRSRVEQLYEIGAVRRQYDRLYKDLLPA